MPTSDRVEINGRGLDRSIVRPFDLGGPDSQALTFAAAAPAGTVIGTIRPAQSATGQASYSTFGTVPSQLALSGDRIVKGAGAAVAGAIYAMGIRADSADGREGRGETIRIRAT